MTAHDAPGGRALQGSRDGPGVQTETECLELVWRALYAPDGVSSVCVRCGTLRRFHRVAGRRAFACGHCGRHVYPTVGTFLQNSKIPLLIWFRAIALIASTPGRLSARYLAEEFGVTARTAARVREQVLAAMQSGGVDARLVSAVQAHAQHAGAAPVLTAESSKQRDQGSAKVRARMDAIAAAACRAFAEHGVASTRVVDIAREAGVSTAIIHYYFKSKEQVLVAALAWAAGRVNGSVNEVLDLETDHLERLRRLMGLWIPRTNVVRAEYVLWLEVYVLGRTHHGLLEECVGLSDSWRAGIERVVHEGTVAGVFKPVAPAWEIAHRLVNLLDGLCFRLVVGYPALQTETVTDLVYRFAAEQVSVPLGLLQGPTEQAMSA